MKARRIRAVAAGGALTIAASMAGVALTQTPALADVSGSSTAGVACLSNPGTPGGAAAAPFVITAGATLSSPVFPTGASITATSHSGNVTVFVPGPIVQNYVSQLAGYGATLTGLGLGAVTVNLSGTHSTGALTYSSGVLASPTIQTITYTAGAANPLTFTLTGLDFTGSLSSNGSDGDVAAISVGANPTNDGVGLAFQSTPSLTPGTGFGAWNGSLTGIAPGTTGATCAYDASTAPDSTTLNVGLVDPTPTATGASVSLGIGGSKTISLPVSSNGGSAITGCAISTAPAARLAVSGVNSSPGVCTATITDSGVGPATLAFGYTATNASHTSAEGTVTVSIGTPAVDEPINQLVNPGQLQLSCSAPPAAVNTHCNTLNLPAITLNGVAQTVSSNDTPASPTLAGEHSSTLYVSDNRGDPDSGWALQASMVVSSSADNTNSQCSTFVGFCLEKNPSGAPSTHGDVSNGRIAASNLSIGNIQCTPDGDNLNPAATPGVTAIGSPPAAINGGAPGGSFVSNVGICQAAAGQSGGTFDVTKTYSLKIPSSVYAGTYVGTVEYVVS